MKKKVLRVGLLFVGILLASCNFTNKEEKKICNVGIALHDSGDTSVKRTITSVSDVDFSVLEWTIEFREKDAEEPAKNWNAKKNEKGNYEVRIPEGTYVVEASAEYEKIHQYYGKTELSVAVNKNNVCVIPVGLKKTTDGKGYLGTIELDVTEIMEKESNFSGLTAKISSSNSDANKEYELNCSYSEEKQKVLITTADGTEIDSGYYYLQVFYADGTLVTINDSLLEISDGDTSGGNIKAYSAGRYRFYYATATDDGTGNGLTPHNRISFSRLLGVLKTDVRLWSEATVYMDENPEWNFSNEGGFDIEKAVKIVVTDGGNGSASYSVCKNDGKSKITLISGNVTLNLAGGNVEIEAGKDAGKLAVVKLPESTESSFEISKGSKFENVRLVGGLEEYANNEKKFAVTAEENEKSTFEIEDQKIGEETKSYIAIQSGNEFYIKHAGVVEPSLSILPEFELCLLYEEEDGRTITMTKGEAANIEFSFEDDITITVRAEVKNGGDFPTTAKFIWKINDKDIIPVEKGESASSVNEITFKLNKNGIPGATNLIACEVVNGEGTKTEQRKSDSIECSLSMPLETKIMLWNAKIYEYSVYTNSLSQGRTLDGLVSGIQGFEENEIAEGVSVKKSNFAESGTVSNFCFDPNTGDVYALYSAVPLENESVKRMIICSDAIEGGSKTVNRTVWKEYDFNCDSMAYLNGNIYVVLDGNIYYFRLGNTEDTNFGLTEFSFRKGSNSISCVASDGENLYAAYCDAAESGSLIKIAKFNMDNRTDSETADSENEISSSISRLKISDMQISGNSIYALLLQQVDSNRYHKDNRGGLIKLDVGEKSITWNGNTDSVTTVLGWYEPAVKNSGSDAENPLYCDDSGLESCNHKLPQEFFFGPRKFIAIKPDALWIADEGGYCESSGNKKRTTNRVVKVNLGDLSKIEKSVNVDCSLSYGFGGSDFERY